MQGADPADNASELLDSPTMSLTDLGQNSTLSFYRDSGAATVVFPGAGRVGSGISQHDGEFPFAIRSGLLSVFQGERVIRLARLAARRSDAAGHSTRRR